MKKKDKQKGGFSLRIHCETARKIRQHARSSMKAEICGVLIGHEDGDATVVEASIPGANAEEAGTHVTFTQGTWEHIYKIKDQDYPDARIVGWYHSHPGFGVFLSDHDTFIHKNFFSSPRQVAWVYDPHSDEEGCFGWVGDKIARLNQILFTDEKGGEGAGETGKSEPSSMEIGEHDLKAQKAFEEPEQIDVRRLLWQGIKYLATFIAGFVFCLILVLLFLLHGVALLSVPANPDEARPQSSAGGPPSATSVAPQTNPDKKGKP